MEKQDGRVHMSCSALLTHQFVMCPCHLLAVSYMCMMKESASSPLLPQAVMTYFGASKAQ